MILFQICRLVYELMQTQHSDASDLVHSLDDEYYYTGQTSREERAIFPHLGKDQELTFEVDDVMGIAGNHWDGQSKGTHIKTMTVGLYPSFKMEKLYQIISAPKYLDVLAQNNSVT